MSRDTAVVIKANLQWIQTLRGITTLMVGASHSWRCFVQSKPIMKAAL